MANTITLLPPKCQYFFCLATFPFAWNGRLLSAGRWWWQHWVIKKENSNRKGFPLHALALFFLQSKYQSYGYYNLFNNRIILLQPNLIANRKIVIEYNFIDLKFVKWLFLNKSCFSHSKLAFKNLAPRKKMEYWLAKQSLDDISWSLFRILKQEGKTHITIGKCTTKHGWK